MSSRLGYTLAVLLAFPSVSAAQLLQPSSSDATRLASVSPQRDFYESNAGKAAQAKLATLQSATSKEVEARNTKLKALQDALAQNRSVLGEPSLRLREQEIDKFQIDLQRFVEDAQAQFLGVRRDFENALLAKFVPAVDTVAKKRGLLFAFNQDSGLLAWADSSLDITKDVVEVVNQP